MLSPVIILAGGASTRMGCPKGLVRVAGRTWAEVQLEQAHLSGASQVVFVLGHGAQAYEAQISWSNLAVLWPQLSILRVTNPKPDRGPFSSLKVGLENLPVGHSGTYVLPIDVPMAEPQTIAAMEAARAADTEGLLKGLVPEFKGRGGHPVWLSRSLIDHILALDFTSANSRLDFVIRALPPHELRRVVVDDPHIVGNLNTPEDFKSFTRF